MHSRTPSKWAAYAATVTALGGSAASASIVYKNFQQTLTDPDAKASNLASANTSAAIHFDGTSLTLNTTSTNSFYFTCYDAYSTATGDSAKTPTIVAYNGYVQTPEIRQAGALIGDAFTQSSTVITPPAGNLDHAYIGISTPTQQYGWICFSSTDGGKTVIIHDAAIQTTAGQTINAGDGRPVTTSINRPSTKSSATATLSKLSEGLVELRRRRSMGSAA